MIYSQNKKNILIAPLDWGLGHATRCIPIINTLLADGHNVTIAASGASLSLLKKEFPQLHFVEIKGYNIQYSRSKIGFLIMMLWQLPKIGIRIIKEHVWLKKWVSNHPVDFIISDNRLGLYHRSIPSYYITHQLNIKAGNKIFDWIARKIHYHFINKYYRCWIPDVANVHTNIAGELSHPKKFPRTPISYIGPLSRFERMNTPIVYNLLVLISGPEPQRTIFETLVLNQIKAYKGSVLIVRGLPNSEEPEILLTPTIKMAPHLSAKALNTAICQSEIIISRSGYTTIMDLLRLQKNALLIPTPGQTEQEYLAQYLMRKKYFYTVTQSDFCLIKDINILQKSDYQTPSFNTDAYKEAIADLTNTLKQYPVQ